LNNTGLNGISISPNLSGTVTVTAGSNTVTGQSTTFATQFIVGDVIRTASGQAMRIVSVHNNTSLTVEGNWVSTENNVTFRRGGRAPNTWYQLYAIGNTNAGNFILSTRNIAANEALLDLPSGYNRQRQLAFSSRTDANGNLLPFIVANGWPINPTILYGLESYNILSGSSTTFTVVNTNNFVPTTSRIALIDFGILAVSNIFNQATIRQAGSTGAGRILAVPANITGVNHRIPQQVWVNTTGQFEYSVADAATTLEAFVTGFIITEIS
jgi:hypothetical protein